MTDAELVRYAIHCLEYAHEVNEQDLCNYTDEELEQIPYCPKEFKRLLTILEDLEQDFYDIEADAYLKTEEHKECEHGVTLTRESADRICEMIRKEITTESE